MRYSFKIGSAWGIPIELHFTFLLLIIAVLALSVYSMQFYTFLLVLFLFIFVVFHELAHSVVARHYGIKVRKIILYPIGGVSEIEEIPQKPSIEWRMAVAGPLTSLVIGGILLGLSQAVLMETPSIPFTVAGSMVRDLGVINLALGAFNLIPAFPMDGGRVLRAFLAERIKFTDATRYAAFIGRLFGIALAIVGIVYNFWLIIVGVFIYIGATEEAESTILSTAIAQIRVGDVMYREAATVKPEATLAEALEVMLRARYHDVLVEKDGALQGVVCWDDIMKVRPEQRSQLKMGQMAMKQFSAFPDESVLEVYKIMSREKIHVVPVVDKEDPRKVIGAVTSESINYIYEKAKNAS